MADWIATIDVGNGGAGMAFWPTHRIEIMLWDRAAVMLFPDGAKEPTVTWLPDRPENHLRDALAMIRLHVGGWPADAVPPRLSGARVELGSADDPALDALAAAARDIEDLAIRVDEDVPGELGIDGELNRRLRGVEVRLIRTVER